MKPFRSVSEAPSLLVKALLGPEYVFVQRVVPVLRWSVRAIPPDILSVLLSRLAASPTRAPYLTTLDGDLYLFMELRETPSLALPEQHSPTAALSPVGKGRLRVEAFYDVDDFVFVIEGRVAREAALVYKRLVALARRLAKSLARR